MEAATETGIEFIDWDRFYSLFDWKQGEHVTLIGPTGQGKTTLAVAILEKRGYVCVVATKRKDPLIGQLQKDGYEIQKEFVGNTNLGTHIILKPPHGRTASITRKSQQRAIAACLDRVYHQGNWALYIDEGQYVAEFLRLGMEMELLWRQGRSLGVSLITGTQRPVNIPLAAYSQATHLFFWRDSDEVNLRRIGGLGGISARTIRAEVANLRRHEVLYLNTRSGHMVRTKVKRK